MKEIIKILPEYNKLSKKKKMDLLILLLSWTSGELNRFKIK